MKGLMDLTEYVDKNELRNDLYESDAITMEGVKIINKFPTDDVAPVRHGRWIAMHYEGGILDGSNFDKCSVCGYERFFDDEKLKTKFNFCPNCGAIMDGET